MRVQLQSSAMAVLALAVQSCLADKWTFSDGLITVSTRGDTEAGRKEQYFDPQYEGIDVELN